MLTSFYRQLTVIILLVTVLFTPLASIAHDLKLGTMKETCACQMPQNDCSHDGTGRSDDFPGNTSDDCCGHEECCHDTLEPAHDSVLNIHLSPQQTFHSVPAVTFPKVYLAIFVPPES